MLWFQAEDGIRDLVRSRGLGDVYKRQEVAGDLPELPLFLVANEFFDALPIHQFQFQNGHWLSLIHI